MTMPGKTVTLLLAELPERERESRSPVVLRDTPLPKLIIGVTSWRNVQLPVVVQRNAREILG